MVQTVKSRTRLDAVIAVVGIAVLVVLEGEIYSLHGIVIVAGFVTGITCLIYAPTTLLKSLLFAAIICSFFYLADRLKEWQTIGIMVLFALTINIHTVLGAENRISSKIDGLERRLDAIESKVDKG